jgi:type II secretory pathway pseudopilin PulG
MVALVILSLVATGFLETFAGSVRGNAEARSWAQALVYAEEGQALMQVAGTRGGIREPPLGGGFTRSLAVGPWQPGVDRATVTVTLPDGARFSLDWLVPAP